MNKIQYKKSVVAVVLVIVTVILIYTFLSNQKKDYLSSHITQPDLSKSELKNLPVSPENKRVDLKKPVFSNPTKIDNILFPVTNLKQAILLGNDDGRPLQVVYTLLPESKNRIIDWNGGKVETRTIQYLAYFDHRLIEYAYDWYAQADDGSVWYFGEEVFNLSEGVLTDKHGTWLADKDGPVAMIMPANPKTGDVYRVENIPGVAFEEVAVKSINQTIEGPLGKVSGCMIGSQLHDNGSYSDKIFCPNYGEFFTEKDLDLEALAIAIPADTLNKKIPIQLSSLSDSVFNIYNALEKNDWKSIQNEVRNIKTQWSTLHYNSDKISNKFIAKMNRAIKNIDGDELEPASLAQHKIGTMSGAIDIAFSSLDIAMRYSSSTDIDIARIPVWSMKTIIDANALEHGFLLSDVKALELLFERVEYAMNNNEAKKMSSFVKDLRLAVDAEDYNKVKSIAQEMLKTFSK